MPRRCNLGLGVDGAGRTAFRPRRGTSTLLARNGAGSEHCDGAERNRSKALIALGADHEGGEAEEFTSFPSCPNLACRRCGFAESDPVSSTRTATQYHSQRDRGLRSNSAQREFPGPSRHLVSPCPVQVEVEVEAQRAYGAGARTQRTKTCLPVLFGGAKSERII